MKLSMWILADWLEKYHPEPRIENGEAVLRGARILSPDTRIEIQNVYLAPAEEFISGQGNKVLCVHGHDLLLLDTADMDSVLNDIFDAFDYYNSWSDGLANDIMDGCSLQHLLDESFGIFGEPALIFDAGHMVAAYTRQYEKGTVDEEWDVMLSTGSNSFEILNKMKDHLKRSRSCHGVQALDFPYFSTRSFQRMLYHGQTIIGRIIMLEFKQPVSRGKMQLLDMLGNLAELWMVHTENQNLLRSEYDIFRDLLDKKTVSEKELNYKLAIMGWEQMHRKTLMQIEIPAVYQDITWPLLAKLERLFEECYVFLHKKSIFILANHDFSPPDALCREIKALLRQSVFHCAVSYPFYNIMELCIPASQCALTLKAAARQKGGIYHCSEYALDYIYSVLSSHVSKAIVHPALPLLRENDKESHNDLYQTLYAYLTHNCNLAHTARFLNLHRNSLLYRLHKIQDLTGLDFTDGRVREYLYLSYIIEREK